MKRRCEISPGQLTIFDHAVYANQPYKNLKDAMIQAMQDFYIRKIYPRKIITINNVYDLKSMKKFWQLYDLYNLYVC